MLFSTKRKGKEEKMSDNFFFRDMKTGINYRFSSRYSYEDRKDVIKIVEDNKHPLSANEAFKVITYLLDIYKPNSNLKDFKESMTDMAMVKNGPYGEFKLFDHTFFEKIYTYTDYLDDLSGNTLTSAFYGMILLGEVKKIIEYPIFVSIIQDMDTSVDMVEILNSFNIDFCNPHEGIPFMDSRTMKTSRVSYCTVKKESDVVSIKMATDGTVSHYDFLKEVDFLPPYIFYDLD